MSSDNARQFVADRPVLVLGTGRDGSAFIDWYGRPDLVTAYDEQWGPRQEEWAAEHPGVAVSHGSDLPLDDVQLALKSPGISRYGALAGRVRDAGVEITTVADLWMRDHARDTIGVTGSKGKSTTSSLIAHLMRSLGVDTGFGGNIGIPLLTLDGHAAYAVELSSYMCADLTVSPRVAVVTSLFEEHLDWHGTAERYFADKLNIAQHGAETLVVNALDDTLMPLVAELETDAAVVEVGRPGGWRVDDGWIARGEARVCRTSDLQLLGDHNAINATLALAAIEAFGVDLMRDPDATKRALMSFAPLEHRLQPVPDSAGIRFVNDSLSTSPHSAITALRAVGDERTVLLVGGQDRGVDYAPLGEYLAEHPVALVIGMPDSGARIVDAVRGSGVETVMAASLPDAVRISRERAPSGGVVLLSPAAPSYGVYRDYADRAAAFVKAIEETSGMTTENRQEASE